MTVVSPLGRKQSTKISRQLRFFLGSKDYCPPSQSNLYMQQVGIFLFRSQCTRYKAQESFHFADLQRQSSVQYSCRWQTHPLSFEVTSGNFATTLAEPFPCCLPFETQSGDHSWGRLEPLHATAHRLRLKCDGTRAETRFRISTKRTNPFKSAGASVQSTTGS